MQIITNNPQVFALYPEAKRVPGKPIDVLSECRRKVQEGYPLLTHPLMGDIHLLANPFRTAILGDRKEEVDPLSLQWVEESIEKVLSATLNPKGVEDVDDYQAIDRELVEAYMRTAGVAKIPGQS